MLHVATLANFNDANIGRTTFGTLLFTYTRTATNVYMREMLQGAAEFEKLNEMVK